MAAADIITGIIADAKTYAETMVSNASDYAASAVSLASGGSSFTLANRGDIQAPSTIISVPSDPGVFTGNFVAPTDSIAAPIFKDVNNIDVPIFPLSPAALDTSGLFNFPKPSFDISQFTELPPEIDTTFILPPTPVVAFPDAPATLDVVFPSIPTPTIPNFDVNFNGTVPVLGDAVGSYQSAYRSMLPVMQDFVDSGIQSWMDTYAPRYADQLNQLEQKISTSLPGGQAFDDAFEQALYDRHRDRIHAEARANYTQATENAAKRGFLLPQGVLTAVLQQIQKASSDRIADAATQVHIERRKLEVQHLQFVMNLSKDIRQMMLANQIGYATLLVHINGQALDNAKTLAGLIIEVFNSSVKLFEAQLDQYKTEASVFEIRLKAALANLEVTRIQLDLVKTQVDVNRNQIEAYTSRIRAEEVKVGVYVAQLTGLKTKADLQRLKLELFSEKVRAFISRVQMKEAEFGAYRSAIEGDKARVDSFVAQVEAYRAEVDAEKTKVSAQVALNEAVVQYNNIKLQSYEALLEKIKTQMQVELAKFESQAKAYDTRLDLYKTQADVQLKEKEMQVSIYQSQVQQLIQRLDLDLKTVVAASEIFIKQVSTAAETSISAANVSANIASSAVASLNNVIQLGDQTNH